MVFRFILLIVFIIPISSFSQEKQIEALQYEENKSNAKQLPFDRLQNGNTVKVESSDINVTKLRSPSISVYLES